MCLEVALLCVDCGVLIVLCCLCVRVVSSWLLRVDCCLSFVVRFAVRVSVFGCAKRCVLPVARCLLNCCGARWLRVVVCVQLVAWRLLHVVLIVDFERVARRSLIVVLCSMAYCC